MRKLLLIFAIICNCALAGFKLDLGYATKVVDKGVVSIEDVAFLDTTANVKSFGGRIQLYNDVSSLKQAFSNGSFKRIDVSADYLFTSTLADLHLGTTYRNLHKGSQWIAARDSVEPYIRINGNIVKKFPWEIKGEFDLKNKTNNFEAFTQIPFGWDKTMILPTLGIGFNDPGAPTLDVLKNAKNYYIYSLSVVQMSVIGNISAEVYSINNNVGAVVKYTLELK